MTRNRPPLWFRIAGALLVCWGLAGVAGFHMSLTEAARAAMTPYDRALYANQPAWYMPVYGIAVWAGLVGSVLLLLGRRVARGLYALSLVAVVVMFGWIFAATDLIAVKGIAVATGFPVVIAAIGVFEIWLAGHAIRRGWIA